MGQNKFYRLAVGLTVVGSLAVGGSALAAIDAVAVAKTRDANFHQLGAAFKKLNDQLKADKPDTAVIAAQAKTMHDLAKKLPSWFPKGTGMQAAAKTRAKDEIWSDPAGFAKVAKALEVETGKLEVIAKGGDVEAIKAQVKATGGACGGCHTKFRGPDKDHEHEAHG